MFQFVSMLFSPSLFAGEKPVIVVFKDKPGLKETGKIKNHNGKIKRIHSFVKAVSATLPEAEISKLKDDPLIAYIQEDVLLSLVSPLSGDELGNSWGAEHIGAFAVHDNGVRGKGVKIAVLDSGIDYMHAELAGNYKGGYDFVFDDNDPYDDGYNSHGTHVSGIIAAAANGTGIVGVAPETSLYAVKVLDGAGFASLSNILAGIEWAIMNGMDIISMSFGTTFQVQLLEEACNSAYEKGVLLVAAAGNNRGGAVSYPASYASVVAVSAIDIDHNISSWSAIGPEVELVAPGINILSTMTAEKGNYGYLHGSSQAAPYVTGAAALLISSGTLEDMNGDGLKDNRDVRLALIAHAMDLGGPGFDELYGNGMVRVSGYGAIEKISLVTEREKKMVINGREINLDSGTYRINIKNNDLLFLRVALTEKMYGEIVEKKLHLFNFIKDGDDLSLSVDLSNKEGHMVFYPHGRAGTSAEITVYRD
ncbi:MAG: S8 family peptidase [Deltaproteobacteria bacterium]|nr:S8 family peptidase [Deltaproteobacteria bacterium]